MCFTGETHWWGRHRSAAPNPRGTTKLTADGTLFPSEGRSATTGGALRVPLSADRMRWEREKRSPAWTPPSRGRRRRRRWRQPCFTQSLRRKKPGTRPSKKASQQPGPGLRKCRAHTGLLGPSRCRQLCTVVGVPMVGVAPSRIQTVAQLPPQTPAPFPPSLISPPPMVARS